MISIHDHFCKSFKPNSSKWKLKIWKHLSKCYRMVDFQWQVWKYSPLCTVNTTAHRSNVTWQDGFWSFTSIVWWRRGQDAIHPMYSHFFDHGNAWQSETLIDQRSSDRALTSSFGTYYSILDVCDSCDRLSPIHFWMSHYIGDTRVSHSHLEWLIP